MYNYKTQPDIKYAYLKGIRKYKKVTGADKKLSFFGSDFTNGDIGKPDFTECTYKMLADDTIMFRGQPFTCFVVESLPKTPEIMRETGYGRKVTCIEKKTLLTLRIEYFDENLIKLKELNLISFITRNNVQGKKVYYTTGLEMKKRPARHPDRAVIQKHEVRGRGEHQPVHFHGGVPYEKMVVRGSFDRSASACGLI